MKSYANGFSLVELMIAIAIGMLLTVGVSSVYMSIKSVTQTSNNLQNAQEVIRFTSITLSRSLKQTSILPAVSPDRLVIKQRANSIACTGEKQTADYTETYTFADGLLQCNLGSGAQTILAGLSDIKFSLDRHMVSVTVTPAPVDGEPALTGPTLPMQIDIALTLVILSNATGGAS